VKDFGVVRSLALIECQSATELLLHPRPDVVATFGHAGTSALKSSGLIVFPRCSVSKRIWLRARSSGRSAFRSVDGSRSDDRPAAGPAGRKPRRAILSVVLSPIGQRQVSRDPTKSGFGRVGGNRPPGTVPSNAQDRDCTPTPLEQSNRAGALAPWSPT
jgi:hypothetical protein